MAISSKAKTAKNRLFGAALGIKMSNCKGGVERKSRRLTPLRQKRFPAHFWNPIHADASSLLPVQRTQLVFNLNRRGYREFKKCELVLPKSG
ncbi:hypothetical protein [Gloeobacter violaceus]|uniref:hypothetical protein n=1 Tax=Gloeobacter violaceus TaxID=33072 RepID=UPI0013E8BC32|nr:hypothetical protein [Gloeobacter violaceus]